MAFSLFQKYPAGSAAPALEPEAAAPERPRRSEGESIEKIFERLELELGAMVRRLEREADAEDATAQEASADADQPHESSATADNVVKLSASGTR
jgi:methyl-accepting chemotaxis protein